MKAFKDLETQEKARVERGRLAKLVNCRSLKRRRRKAGEIPDARTAIQNFCRECMGWSGDDMPSLKAKVKDCTAYECWLHPWRLGVLDEEDTKR